MTPQPLSTYNSYDVRFSGTVSKRNKRKLYRVNKECSAGVIARLRGTDTSSCRLSNQYRSGESHRFPGEELGRYQRAKDCDQVESPRRKSWSTDLSSRWVMTGTSACLPTLLCSPPPCFNLMSPVAPKGKHRCWSACFQKYLSSRENITGGVLEVIGTQLRADEKSEDRTIRL